MSSRDFSPSQLAGEIYRRRPLTTPKSTRVLHIMPAQAAYYSDIIECRLSVVSLGDNPDFRALSYVWGDAEATRSILVDGEPFRVRLNLWSFLSQMRRERCSWQFWKSPSPFWIDAICIDQSNLVERGNQVSIMGQIYSQATEVVAWLGNGERSHRMATERLKAIDWSSLRGSRPSSPWLSRKWFSTRHTILSEHQAMRVITEEHLAPCLELLQSEYWSRVWIVQECVLAKNIVVRCGESGLDWDTLDSFEKTLHIAKWNYLSNSSNKDLIARNFSGLGENFMDQIDRSVGAVIAKRRRRHHLYSQLRQLQDYSEFAWLIRQFSKSQCSDIRDHIYGLLSLNAWASENIVPDYGKSALELFVDVSQHFKPHLAVQENYVRVGKMSSEKQVSGNLGELLIGDALLAMVNIFSLNRTQAQVSATLDYYIEHAKLVFQNSKG